LLTFIHGREINVMKTIVVYTSQTGFTKRYAEWIAEDLSAELITLDEAKKKGDSYFADADAILYGGWAMGGKVVKGEWFLQRIDGWKGKKLALFCVGGSPNANPDVDVFLETALTEEQKKYAAVFFCQGGIDYDKMKLPSRLAMKAFSSSLKNKKNATEKEKMVGEYLSRSYDISDKKYIEPIIEYINNGKH